VKAVPWYMGILLSLCNSQELQTTAGLKQWLVSHEFASEQHDTGLDDADRIAELRDAIRTWVGSGASSRPAPQVVEAVNRAGRRTLLRFSISEDGHGELLAESPSPADEAVGAILAALREALQNGTWLRLKICRDPGCGRMFLDRSRNRSGVWCDMAVCGNRAKARTFRERRRAVGSSPGGP